MMPKAIFRSLVVLSVFAATPMRAASETSVHPDIPFATASGRELRLDLFVPKTPTPPPLVVFIHGGGWKSGTRKDDRLKSLQLPLNGFAVASIDYRFSSEATFPAQIHDCKSAIRWLRAHAGEFGYDASRIAVIGTSAGAHLAVLLGTSAGVKSLEGEGNADQSSAVQAVVDFYGATDFVLRAKTQPEMTEKPDSLVYELLGGPVAEKTELAKLASGVSHVTSDDPPLLIIHGDADPQVLPDQSHRLAAVYRDHGLDVTLRIVPKGTHTTDSLYFKGGIRDVVLEFLKRHLLPVKTEQSS